MGSESAQSAPGLGAGRQGFRITFRSDKSYLGPVRTLVQEAIALTPLDETEAAKIVLAVQEGCANVIRHCYRDCDDKRIDIAILLDDNALEIRIDDYGTFVDPEQIKSRDLEDVRPGGLGVHLMQQAMDIVDYRRNRWGGTTLTLIKRLTAAGEPVEGKEKAGG